MNILVVGSGGIAARHIKNIRKQLPDSEITLCRSSRGGAAIYDKSAVAAANRVSYCIEDALRTKPRLALICCATSAHIDYALALARQGVHIFVEKPLSNSLDGLSELEEAVKKNKLAFLVGYNLRFSKSLVYFHNLIHDEKIGSVVSVRIEVGQYLPDWRSGDYRDSTSAQRHLGGGVVLELSHELDYFSWIFGKPSSVYANLSKRSDLDIDVEDSADILVETKKGVTGLIHLNMVQRKKSRSCIVIGTKGFLTWDGMSQTVNGSTAKGDRMFFSGGKCDIKQSYAEELRYFLGCVEDVTVRKTDFGKEREIVEFILAVKDSASQRKLVIL